eukprot:symbB.v1.2.022413.t2/scaffold1989.1/size93477/1
MAVNATLVEMSRMVGIVMFGDTQPRFAVPTGTTHDEFVQHVIQVHRGVKEFHVFVRDGFALTNDNKKEVKDYLLKMKPKAKIVFCDDDVETDPVREGAHDPIEEQEVDEAQVVADAIRRFETNKEVLMRTTAKVELLKEQVNVEKDKNKKAELQDKLKKAEDFECQLKLQSDQFFFIGHVSEVKFRVENVDGTMTAKGHNINRIRRLCTFPLIRGLKIESVLVCLRENVMPERVLCMVINSLLQYFMDDENAAVPIALRVCVNQNRDDDETVAPPSDEERDINDFLETDSDDADFEGFDDGYKYDIDRDLIVDDDDDDDSYKYDGDGDLIVDDDDDLENPAVQKIPSYYKYTYEFDFVLTLQMENQTRHMVVFDFKSLDITIYNVKQMFFDYTAKFNNRALPPRMFSLIKDGNKMDEATKLKTIFGGGIAEGKLYIRLRCVGGAPKVKKHIIKIKDNETVQKLTKEGAEHVVQVNNSTADASSFSLQNELKSMSIDNIQALLNHLEDVGRERPLHSAQKLAQLSNYVDAFKTIEAMQENLMMASMKVKKLVADDIYNTYENKVEAVKVAVKMALALKVQLAQLQQQGNAPP